MNSARLTTVVAGALLAAGSVALAGPAAACDGGVTAPVKSVLHLAEGPVAGTPGGLVLHTVECVLP